MAAGRSRFRACDAVESGYDRAVRALVCLLVLFGATTSVVESLPQSAQEGPIPHDSGQGVTPSFEGWYQNSDGTYSLSFGYFNRNYREELDIQPGPNNKLEPGPVDQ